MRQALRVAWYRFRATFRRRWGGYLTLVLLIGLVGGLAMGAVAAARRTQSSFPAFLSSTNPSDLTVIDANSNDSTVHRTIAGLPHVKHVESDNAPTVFPLRSDGSHGPDTFSDGVLAVGTDDGLYFDEDRVTVTQGRMANPKRRDEFVMTAEAAHLLHLRLGAVGHFGIYSDAEQNAPGFDTARVEPIFRIDVKLVGIVVFNNQVVQDDVDRVPTYMLFTPALTRSAERTLGDSGSLINALQLDHGARDVAAVEAEVKRAVPDASVQSVTSIKTAAAERAIEPESIALGVFGGIAALAVLLIAAQVIGRQLRLRADELEKLRALGADPAMTSMDGLVGIGAAIVVGALLGVAVAVGLSPLAPLGPVRPVDPSPGIAYDWTVLGFGALVLIIGSGAIAWALAFRTAPHRLIRRGCPPRRGGRAWLVLLQPRGCRCPRLPGSALLSNPGPVAVRSRCVRPSWVRRWRCSSSLRRSSSPPASTPLSRIPPCTGGTGPMSCARATRASRIFPNNTPRSSLDTTPTWPHFLPCSSTPSRSTARPFRSWPSTHTLRSDRRSCPGMPSRGNQIVLGANTLTALHKRVGDTVAVSTAAAKPTRLHIVGTATLPAIGNATGFHLEIGTGAVIPDTLIPTSDRGFGEHDGPEAIFVRLRDGANQTAALVSLRHIAKALYTPGDGTPTVVAVQRPAEIVNYGALGTTPALLGAALALGAVIALGLTLIASVRRRQRDLALLKTLGFTHRQLAAAVAWQSTIAVTIGTIVGVPLGIVLGRTLWDLFAHQVHVVPAPNVPTTSIILIAIGALALANIVGAIPGRQAARTPTALLLRAE